MRLTILLTALLLSACATSPKLHTDAAKSYADTIQYEQLVNLDLSQNETRSLEDILEIGEIEPWLKRLYRRSFDLEIKQIENLQQALLVKQSKSQRLPNLHLISSASRSKTNQFHKIYQTEYQLGAQVSWEMNLWNKLGLQSDAVSLDYKINLIQSTSLKTSLTARALKHLLSLKALDTQLAYDRRIKLLLGNLEDQAEQQWTLGFIPLRDYELAKERKLAAQSSLEQTSLAYSDNELLLRQLAQMDDKESLPDWNGYVALPRADISGRYLLQRPDVHQALMHVTKADIEGKVAYRNLFPSFSVNLDANLSSIGNQNLLGQDPLWQLLGQLTAPVFEGGRLRRNVAIAAYESQKAYAAYKRQLQEAYYEVRGFMMREANLTKQLQTQIARLSSFKKQYHTSKQRFLKGLGSLEAYASSEINLLEQKKESARLEHQQALNRIDLFLALGLPVFEQNKEDNLALTDQINPYEIFE